MGVGVDLQAHGTCGGRIRCISKGKKGKTRGASQLSELDVMKDISAVSRYT